MAFRNFANCTRLNQFNDAAIIVLRMDLSSHLSRHAGRCSCFSNQTRLVNIVRQRLFAVHMFAQLKCRQRGEGMCVFAGADNNGIEFIGVIKDAAKVGFLASLTVLFNRAIQIVRVDVAQRRNMFGRDGLQIATASTATANHCNPQLVQSRCGSHGRSSDKQAGRDRGGSFQKRTAVRWVLMQHFTGLPERWSDGGRN